TLPLAEFHKVAEALKPCGYRPIRLRPLAHGEGVLVAAVWVRDGRGGEAVHGLSASGAREQKGRRHEPGWEPLDVAGYLEGGRERYAVVWVRADPLTPNPSPPRGEGRKIVDWYVGVPEARHRVDGSGPLLDAKLNQQTIQLFVGPGGRVFS